MSQPLVEVRGLSKHFVQRGGLLGRRSRVVRALEEVELSVQRGETLGVVGESGCGKTTLGRCILRLIEPTAGQVFFEGVDLMALSREEMRQRRRDMQMVFQNPYSSLDPRFNVLNLVAEPIVTHTDLRGEALTARVEELLARVGMEGDFLYRYPHEFSGGQLQRIAVARALALNPRFLVLDEPTSALDVSVQAQILNLLQQLQRELGLTYLFISHDLSVVQHISDRIAVMYLGRVVEMSTTDAIFYAARHPYTEALLSSTPILDPALRRERIILEGSVPSPANPPPGCRFHPRCPKAMDVCSQVEPKLEDVGGGHLVACHLVMRDP
ncbi:MAG: dipeptide ABC transporter ATP-binding protein [Anaerolineae bacterium]|nr:dipeptide ABC transporter ATP-binding protein [Anaerolineae bacterium]